MPGPRTTVVVVDVEAMEVDEVVAATAVVVAATAEEDMEVTHVHLSIWTG